MSSTASPRHLVHIFPTFAVGGAQMRFARLAAMHGARYRHSVVALDGVTTMYSRLASEIAVEMVPVAFDKRRGLANLPHFRRIIQDLRPDTLVTYNWGSIEWALARRFFAPVRHVHIEDGFGPDEARRQLPRRVWMRRLALSDQNTTVVLPSRTLERLARAHWRLPAARIVYVPNGIDCALFAGVPRARHDDLVIGTIATLRPEKNLRRLIDAVAALPTEPDRPPCRLVIMGDGPARADLEAAAALSPAAARISLPGPTSTPETALAGFDVFALSSDTEQMPLSILEAMAAGLAIVATAVGDVPDMVSVPNRPFVTRPGDEAAFTAALKRLVDDPGLRAELGAANAADARARFDAGRMAAAYTELYG